MLVGNGLIASVFKDYKENDRYVLFASGVSSSSNTSEEEYTKEKEMIKAHYNTKSKFIYFSSALLEKKTRYFNHKREIEEMIAKNMESYIIFRVPNVIGFGGNKNNIFNFFKDKIEKEEKLDIIDSFRSFVDVEDLRKICERCFKENRETLILSEIESLKVIDIVNLISDEIGKEPKVNILSEKENIDIKNSSKIENAILDLKIVRNGYTKKIIKKYT